MILILSVYFNEIVFAGLWVKGKLDIAAAFYLKFSDDLDGAVVEHFQVTVI